MIWTQCGETPKLNSKSAATNNVTLKENTLVTLKVARTGEMGAFLDAGTGNTSDDILLHHDQQTTSVEEGDLVDVFLYHDPKGRLTASMRLPRIQPGQIAYAEVIQRTRFGAFVDLGTERGIFLPFAEMKGNLQEGDRVWVRLYEDKSGRLAVSMDVGLAMQSIAKPSEGIERGDEVTAAIYNITADGALGITPQKYLVFIHRDEWDHTILVGEMVKARVTFVRADGRLNASLRAQKETAIATDAATILAYLEARGGVMPYTDKSDPTVIRRQFNLSKSAFKRALGHLMKQGKITQDNVQTRLVE
ncbi:MAG: S1 RNA-binding domain-containing protein [Negativicoccus succinicivorans]|nr:S1 RNA-binding domain-containing protein [Negativicoccus succinicivorans]